MVTWKPMVTWGSPIWRTPHMNFERCSELGCPKAVPLAGDYGTCRSGWDSGAHPAGAWTKKQIEHPEILGAATQVATNHIMTHAHMGNTYIYIYILYMERDRKREIMWLCVDNCTYTYTYIYIHIYIYIMYIYTHIYMYNIYIYVYIYT